MGDFQEECKKWISGIQKLELDIVVESLKNIKNIKHDADSNKNLFKLLLHLSHCADRCYREKQSKEIQIFTIASIICENLSSVPDKNKLFSALYYILFYLLNKQFFNEAKVITSYLFPGKIVDADDHYESSKYYQISSLWYSEIFKKIDILISNSKTLKVSTNEDLCTYIKFHLQILKFCDESSRYTFSTIDSYTRKFTNIPLVIAFPYLLQLFKHLSNYITNLKSFSVEEAYNLVIPVIGLAFYRRNDAINNANILKYFRECDSYFLEAFRSSPQSYNCYKLFREYSINLFETNFMSNEIGELRLKKSFEILEILLEKYGTQNNSLIETITGMTCSFEALFANWEKSVSEQLANTNITYDDILTMGDFVKRVFSILKNRLFPSNYTCKKCDSSAKCLMKKDIYNASVAVSAYLRLIAKLKSVALNEKIFAIAKELIEELILTLDELEKSGCKFSLPMWDICGRAIFNIGLIGETKFPVEFEGLYEVLCRQIVKRDGLFSKVSSFGLESPIGTTLHRLCNSNFNQEKYRKAMSYTVYNALFSTNESRKKKAYDMWGNIKLKVIDSKEIQELTMSKCLKTDMDIVKNLGISVILEDYDLGDVCLRELKSLYQVKANLILSMKTTLAELESTQNALYYAQGVLLLCFHALQISKREFISEYISKAITKLQNLKPKTPGNQCLLANLNFFNIVEKLYARKQAIDKQIDDANFTVKAFKMMQGKQQDDATEDEDGIVPTYGGINIEEDNRCAKELRDVLSIWETCFQKNLKAIVDDWEPKFTLETIVICGEYCRLYKFNNVEKKSWILAHKLATAIEDFTTCTYVTSRSISLRCINDTWIRDAEKHVESIKSSTKTAEAEVVAIFWLSLADFYLDCKKVEEAKILLKNVRAMPNYEMLVNSKIYIYSTDIEFRNYNTLNAEASQEHYCQLLVEIHYMLINLHDLVNQEIYSFWRMKFLLFALEQMFEVMCNITIPMNSLLSHREIIGHLMYGLKFAQKYGMTLRIAQHLKYHCYIDLLRTQTEDCEARLQDLEHILCLEQFQMSMKAKLQRGASNAQSEFTEKVRDVGQVHPPMKNGGASPELKKKIFSLPDFLVHTSYCECFTCTHLFYQYLAFSCAHIRAQLYSMLSYVQEAEQHFHGAYLIKMRLEEMDSAKSRQYKVYAWKRHQGLEVDYMLYLLDFSMFIVDFMPEKKDDALALIEETLEIATKNDIDKHPVAGFANELYFQHYVYEVFHDKLFITPPEIPITITNQPAEGCITPKHQIEKTSSRNVRHRNKSPSKAVAVPVITIADESSDEENNKANSPVLSKRKAAPSAAVVPALAPVKPKRTSARNVRRKILVDEIEESPGAEEQQPATVTVRKRSTRLAGKS